MSTESTDVSQTRYRIRLVGFNRFSSLQEGEADTRRWFATRNGDYEQRVGDVLTRAVRYKRRKYPDDWDKLPEIIEERATAIKIIAIQAYGKSLDSVGEGMTCALLLEGDTDFLNEDWCFE